MEKINQYPGRRIIICADDYAIAPAVSRVQLELLGLGKLSAASCMVVFDDWRHWARELHPFRGKADLGLHLTLTGPGFGSQRQLWLKSFSGTLSKNWVKEQILRQIDLFRNQMQISPDFIDGHQHIQQLPVVREALIDVINELELKCYVRNSEMRSYMARDKWDLAKQKIISARGRRMARLLNSNKINTNDNFLGIYAPGSKPGYESLLNHFLRSITAAEGENPIWMVHPGRADEDLIRRDSWVELRELEYRVLDSQSFDEELRRQRLQPGRFVSGTHSIS